MEQIDKVRKERDDLVEACKGLVVALRTQSHLARELGGDIALNEGNWPAWKKAEKAISNAKRGN